MREDDPRPWSLGERIAYHYRHPAAFLANQRPADAGEPLTVAVRRWRAERAERAGMERERVIRRRRLP